MCQTCQQCRQCTDYCTCHQAPTYNRCDHNQNCIDKTDAACVVYRFSAPTSLSRLKNLSLPTLTTLEQFMEAVDYQFGFLSGLAGGGTNPLAGLDLTYFRQKYVIKTASDLYGAIQKEIRELHLFDKKSKDWYDNQIQQIKQDVDDLNQPGQQSSVLKINLTDPFKVTLSKIILGLSGALPAITNLSERLTKQENKTITFDIPVSTEPGNRLQNTQKGLYVAPIDSSQVPQTHVSVDNRNRSVLLYAEGENRHTLSAELRIADLPTGLVKNPDGTVQIDPEKFLDYILATPSGSTIRTKFKLIVSQ